RRPGEGRMPARPGLELAVPVRAPWQVVAVPRHPRASGELAAEVRAAGQPVARREGTGAGVHWSASEGADAWRWDDRSGVLNGYYAAADLAFVGGSLMPYGGRNPLEPAAAGAAVVIGPHHPSQSDAVRALEARHAIRIAAPGAELKAALTTLLGDPAERARQAEAGRAAAEEMRGAALRAV